ncbi:MAG: lytic transglycosylase domain-containing protein [Acidimicrobiia bacterium]|nr:lytic transglycosylase domain-containing protein [Acidimicrobiia bacterium]
MRPAPLSPDQPHAPAASIRRRSAAVLVALSVCVGTVAAGGDAPVAATTRLQPVTGVAQNPPAPAPDEPAGMPGDDEELPFDIDVDAAQPWLDDPRSAPELGGVAVDSAEFDAAVSRLRSERDRRDAAEADRLAAEASLVELRDAQRRLTEELIIARRQTTKFDTKVVDLRQGLTALTVADYMRGRTGSASDATFDLDLGASNDGRRHMIRTAFAQRTADLGLHVWALDTTAAHLADLEAELREVEERIDGQEARRSASSAERDRAAAAAEAAARQAADARRTAPVVGLDMTFVVLDAYVRAASTLAEENPGCALPWWLLAGVGRTESNHGTHGGSTVDEAGYQSTPIIGIPLDGNGVARILDTDGGALDGDPVYDRAVGPMQFIPGTWARWGRDATGSGRAEPQNYYDAAESAAAYLCHYGPGLDGEAGQRRALLAYNRSTAYVELVRSRALGYAEFQFPPPPR